MSKRQLIWSILINLLAMPGGGQWHLRLRKRALIFITPSLFIFGGMLKEIIKSVSSQMAGMTHIAAGSNVLAMASQMSEKVSSENESTLNIYIFFLLCLYISSIADVIWLYQSEAPIPEKSASRLGL